MKIENIYSLLHGKWFIDEQYSKSLLPLAYNLISGNGINIITEDQTVSEEFVVVGSSTSSHQRAAANFNQQENENDYVLLVDLKNPIYKYDQSCGPKGTKSKQAFMAMYENDPNMKGIVLDIDSGGGQVSGTPEFHDFYKKITQKPVVAYTDGYMCSAAYYIGAAADHIVANKRADKIGSIGTMISFLDLTGYYEKQGAKLITEYATKSTEKNKDFEELIKGNPEGFIKNELDPVTDEFHADMKAARPNLNEKVLTGATFNTKASKKMGLIDEIGTLQTAINKVFELSKPAKNKSNINNKKNEY